MSLHISSAPPPAWDDWLEAFSRKTLYHTSHWVEAICRAYPQYKARYILDPDRRLLLPFVIFSKRGLKQILSLPFGTFGGPIYGSETSPADIEDLLRVFAREVRGLRVLRYQMALLEPEDALERGVRKVFGDRRVARSHTHVVPLHKGFDWIWNTGYENDVRRCVRKAEKSGVTLAEETNPEGAAALFELYREQTKSWRIRGHSPEALWEVARSLGPRARIWVTRREGRPLTAVLTLYEPGREVRPWVSGANLESRKVKAYHFMMNGIMEHGCGEGYALWDWGGSVGRSSVEAFKRSMAGAPVPVLTVFHEAGWYRRLRGLAGGGGS